MKRWISAVLTLAMIIMLFPVSSAAADETTETVTGYTLTYDYPADLCSFTVYDWHDAEKKPIENGGVLPINAEKNRAYGVFEISDIAEGYRIKDFVVNGSSRAQAMIDGAYGGCAITISKDSTLMVVLEQIPDPLATIQSVELYTDQLASSSSVRAENIAFGDDLKGLHAVVNYADGGSYPSYFASMDWEYSTDGGTTWQIVPGWGNSTGFNAAWSNFSNFNIDFMTMHDYLMRVKVITKEHYSILGENAGVYSQVVSVNSNGSTGGEEGGTATLHKLSAPTDLAWGTYYFENENGETQGVDIPGMMSWTVTDTEYDHEYLLKVYHENDAQEPVFVNGWYYRAGKAEKYTDHDFSNRFPREALPDGAYYFTLQAMGDGVSTSDSDVVTSETWNYTQPDKQYEAPSYPEWAFPMVSWSDYEFTYGDYCSGYSVEYWYSATDAEATTTDNLFRLGGHIWYFGEGNYNTSHVIPKSYLEKMGEGYYYFTVRSHSNDILSVSHSEKTLSEACYFAGDLVTHVTDEGLLVIVDQAVASGTGWSWDGETLTLEAVEDFAVKAIRFLPYVTEAVVVLNSDVAMDSSGLTIAPYEYRPTISLEASEGLLEIKTGEHTLNLVSRSNGLYSGGSMNIVNSTVDVATVGYYEGIYVNRGDLYIGNSNLSVDTGGHGEAIYVHGYRVGEENTCRMGELTIEDSTIFACSMNDSGGGTGNALYSDGNMLITSSTITARGGNNGIGNDCGGVTIQNSTVDSIGEYLGIFSYHTIVIESSTVTAEGTRAIEIASRTEELPEVESFVLKKAEITVPEKHQVALAGVSYPWDDTVVSIIHDVDETEQEVWEPATHVEIVPVENIHDKLSQLIPEEDTAVIVTNVQQSLSGKTGAIKHALNEQLQGQDNGTVELIQQIENKVEDVTAQVTVSEELEALSGNASVVGAVLNAAENAEQVELKLEPTGELAIPEMYEANLTFAMTLEGAVDADNNTDNGQQLVVPVQITLPIPEEWVGFLVLLHYQDDANGPEEILPKIEWVENRPYIIFVTDGFSDYALASIKTQVNVVEDALNVSVRKAVGEQLLCAAYSAGGQMLGATVLNEGAGKISCDSDKVDYVKFFPIDGSHAPVWYPETVYLQ